MRNLDIDQPYREHLLGYYDYVEPPQVYPYAGETHSIASIAMHEQAHEWLVEGSTLGLFLRVLIRAVKRASGNDIVLSVVERVAAETVEVQEGFATYIEYIAASRTVEDFRSELKRLSGPYLPGFDLARAIETILSPTELDTYSPVEMLFLRRCTLIDISRFAMNVPVPETDDANQVVSAVWSNSPNTRWRTVLERLAHDTVHRKALIERAMPMFPTWLKKASNRFGAGVYTGITYADNIESVIAGLFPELPYVLPSEAWFVAPCPKGPELVAEYLVREQSAELRITPQTQIELRQDYGARELCQGFDRLVAVESRGCYVRFLPSWGPGPRCVDVGADLEVPFGFAAVLVHEAAISTDCHGRRLWNYVGDGNACVVTNDSIPEILGRLKWPDAVVVIDCPLESDDPFAPLAWSEVKSPLFLHPTPIGSLAAVIRTLSDLRVREGADVVMMRNWQHFEGAGGDQIFLAWVIPRFAGRRAGIFIFVTKEVIGAIQLLRVQAKLPEEVRFIGGKEDVIIPPLSEEASRWTISDDNPIVHAPANADIVTAHLLAFGW